MDTTLTGGYQEETNMFTIHHFIESPLKFLHKLLIIVSEIKSYFFGAEELNLTSSCSQMWTLSAVTTCKYSNRQYSGQFSGSEDCTPRLWYMEPTHMKTLHGMEPTHMKTLHGMKHTHTKTLHGMEPTYMCQLELQADVIN